MLVGLTSFEPGLQTTGCADGSVQQQRAAGVYFSDFQAKALALTMVLPVLTMLRTVLIMMAAARASRPAATLGFVCTVLVHTG